MNYTFIKNDSSSFSSFSRVYEVYEKSEKIKTVLVIGYDKNTDKYFITLLGDNLLYDKYGLTYDGMTELEYINILNSFFEFLPFTDKIDFVDDVYYSKNKMSELKKENFLTYTAEIEPYYMEYADAFDGIYSTVDKFSNYLIDENIMIPTLMENIDTDEYESYDFDRFVDLYYDGANISIYCEINFELLKKYSSNKID